MNHLRAQWRTAARTYYHASPNSLAPGTVLTPGGGRQNFGGRADSEWVYMTTDEGYAEQWGNAMAQDEYVPRIYIYEVEPRGDVVEGKAGVTDPTGFYDELPESRAEAAVVKRLVYSFDTETGEAKYAGKVAGLHGDRSNPTHYMLFRGISYHPSPAATAALKEFRRLYAAYQKEDRALYRQKRKLMGPMPTHAEVTSEQVDAAQHAMGRAIIADLGDLGEHWSESKATAESFSKSGTGWPLLIKAWARRGSENKEFNPGPFWDEGEINLLPGTEIEIESVVVHPPGDEGYGMEVFHYLNGQPLRVLAARYVFHVEWAKNKDTLMAGEVNYSRIAIDHPPGDEWGARTLAESMVMAQGHEPLRVTHVEEDYTE